MYLRYRTSTHDVLSTVSDVLSVVSAMPSNSIEPMSTVERAVESLGPGLKLGQGRIGRWTSDGTTSHMLSVQGQISEPDMCWCRDSPAYDWSDVTAVERGCCDELGKKLEDVKTAAGGHGRNSRLICGSKVLLIASWTLPRFHFD